MEVSGSGKGGGGGGSSVLLYYSHTGEKSKSERLLAGSTRGLIRSWGLTYDCNGKTKSIFMWEVVADPCKSDGGGSVVEALHLLPSECSSNCKCKYNFTTLL